MSLHLGQEIFDVYKNTIAGDFNHLFVRQGTGLQGQSVFKTKLTFRPHSIDSVTHRKMTMSLADKCSKTNKVKGILEFFKAILPVEIGSYYRICCPPQTPSHSSYLV